MIIMIIMMIIMIIMIMIIVIIMMMIMIMIIMIIIMMIMIINQSSRRGIVPPATIRRYFLTTRSHNLTEINKTMQFNSHQKEDHTRTNTSHWRSAMLE